MSAIKLPVLRLSKVKANLPYQPLVCIDMAQRPESLDELAERVHRRSELYAWVGLAVVAVTLLVISVIQRAHEHGVVS